MFDDQQFSKDLKILKQDYIEEGTSDNQRIGTHIHALARMDLDRLKDDAAKIAFWINVYNGLTNYWVITKGIQKNMLERPFLVMCAKINIGGHRFSLDDIEHGILRNNRRSLYKFWNQFSKKDPRLAYKVDQLDYRIHFALNCGAKSCPAVSFYDAKYLEQQLSMAEENFIEQEFLPDDEKKVLHLSKIFWLYKKDFEDIYINDPKYKEYKIKYRKYDFSIA